MAGDLVDLLGIVRPNCPTRVGRLTVKLSLAAVGNEMYFESSLQRLVVNLQELHKRPAQLPCTERAWISVPKDIGGG